MKKVLGFMQASRSGSSGNSRSAASQWPSKTANPKKVLIVEDDLDAVRAFEALLIDMGHVVEYAINGYVAIDVAKRFRPDVIFLDLGLPGLSGYDVCSRLKAQPGFESTRVIAVTAYGHDDARVRARAAGCERHLLKPVEPDLIAEILG
jgi:two-component system, chemotaxis family, CheB/CheR fusion protein